jgi:hypothetical protein
MSPRTSALVLLIIAAPAGAVQLGDPDEMLSLEVHGFASQGLIYSTHQNEYLAANSSTVSFEFTEIGINFTKQLTDTLRVGMQLFSRELGPLGNYAIKADWYNLDWHPRDWFGIRAGRVKLPFGLYNDTSDIDSARVPVLLPQSIYPAENRDTLLAATGLEIYGRKGPFEYRLYGGAVFIDANNDRLARVNLNTLAINEPYLFGGRVMYDTPLDGLRLGVSVQTGTTDSVVQNMATPPQQASTKVFNLQGVASLEYAAHDLLVAAEYSRWYMNLKSSNDSVVPADTGSSTDRAYAMVSYRFKSWFVPALYYSVLLFRDSRLRTGRAAEQHDVSATLRFDINAYWLIKLEGHFMAGTAALSPVLNGDRPREDLAPYWGAFFIKTTAHF